jgi:pimeloyl-ACP methyl ester carboxylesterase
MLNRKIILPSLILFMFLFACQGTDPQAEAQNTAVPSATAVSPTEIPSATPLKPEPSNEPTATTAIATAAAAVETEPTAVAVPATGEAFVEEVTILGTAELAIQGTLTVPAGAGPHPGVILLHMLGGNRLIWERNGFADLLQENGIASLAIDMRGHGDTGGNQNWELAEEDLRLAVAYFTQREEIEDGTAVIGASIGANMALITGANTENVWTVALLSPGLDYRGVTTNDRIGSYSELLLIIASEGDAYAAQSAKTLQELAPGQAELIIYDGSAHGTNMFSAQPELGDVLVAWLLAQHQN